MAQIDIEDLMAILTNGAALLQTGMKLAAEAKATLSETDAAKIEAKLAEIRPLNDAAYDRAMASLKEASKR